MKHQLASMTWREAADLGNNWPVVLVSVGTIEQNGPHCPLGTDSYIGEHFTEGVARRTGSIVAPPIGYGYSVAFDNFPGSVSLRGETLAALAEDVFEGLARHGVTHILIVNNHGPNAPFLEQASRRVRARHAVRFGMVWPSQVLGRLAAEAIDDLPNRRGHGGEPMVSVISALVPDAVRMDLARPDQLASLGAFGVTGSQSSSFETHPVNLMLDVKEVSDTGTTGDPTHVDASTGQLLLDRLEDWGCRLLQAFSELPVDTFGLGVANHKKYVDASQ